MLIIIIIVLYRLLLHAVPLPGRMVIFFLVFGIIEFYLRRNDFFFQLTTASCSSSIF